MIDHRMQPNPGPHDCSPTCVVLQRDRLEIDYRFDYFMYGQFMKFVRPGARRLASTESGKLPTHVAFRNPDGSLVLVAANPESRDRDLTVSWSGLGFSATLSPRSVSTFRWSP